MTTFKNRLLGGLACRRRLPLAQPCHDRRGGADHVLPDRRRYPLTTACRWHVAL